MKKSLPMKAEVDKSTDDRVSEREVFTYLRHIEYPVASREEFLAMTGFSGETYDFYMRNPTVIRETIVEYLNSKALAYEYRRVNAQEEAMHFHRLVLRNPKADVKEKQASANALLRLKPLVDMDLEPTGDDVKPDTQRLIKEQYARMMARKGQNKTKTKITIEEEPA